MDALFAQLEDRLLLAAQPVVSIDGDTQPLIGEQTQIVITFDNVPDSDATKSDIGYAPYIDLILPKNGADGVNGVGADGISFLSATYLGTTLEATVLEFGADGTALHPFARELDENGQVVSRVVRASDYGAEAGDQLVVFRLPYGSFVPEQPAASITVTLDVSSYADVGTALPITAVGGFAYGRDALDNPVFDAPVVGEVATHHLTPTLLTVEKVFNGPENETATGPNFVNSFTISLDLATGQTITSAVLLDALPDGIVVDVDTLHLSGPGGVLIPGVVAYDPQAHTITATFSDPLTGAAGVDATLTFSFYVAETLVPGNDATPVLDPASGAARDLTNTARAEVDWVPLDERDREDEPLRVVVDAEDAVFTARSIATQKSQSILIDANAGGLGPGDTILYTIDVQISDYFDFQNLVLTDLLSDGQHYIVGTARIDVLENGSTLGSGFFVLPNLVVSRSDTTGVTSFTFDISGHLVANGADGVLQGGDAREGRTGPTTLRITYQAMVDRYFLAPDGDIAVGQGDTLSNTVVVHAELPDAPPGTPPVVVTDDTSSSAQIQTGSVAKSVYAVNGELVGPGPLQIAAGDLITFRLTYTMPQTLTQELRLTDFLPLPVFDVDNFVLTLVDEGGIAAPGENEAKWGPNPLTPAFRAELLDSDGNIDLSRVQVLRDSAANSLTFVFTNLEPALPTSTVADILFTIRVVDHPFGDGLLLTNQVFAVETSTDNTISTSEAITQVTLTEPILRITKGVVATDNPGGTVSIDGVGPVDFTPPGSSGPRFSSTIDSAGLAVTPVNSDLGNVDAGDRVTFALVIENIGTGRDGAFDVAIKDTLPAGFSIPPSGLNLQVTNGAGQVLTYTGNPMDLFQDGIQLDDGANGAIAAYSSTGGANIVVITYDLVLTNQVEARAAIVNTATIDNYAAVEGGIDRVPSTAVPTSDDATVQVRDPSIVKTVYTTSLTETGSAAGNGSITDLAIGETITFDLTVTLHEGRIQGLQIVDTLPFGLVNLDPVSYSIVSIGQSLFVRNADGSLGAPLGTPTVTASGNLVTFTFADDIINRPDNVVNADDRIVVRVTAVVADLPGNTAGTVLTNTGALQFTLGNETVSIIDTAQAEIVEPSFNVTKTADREVVQGGDIITYTVRLDPVASTHAGPMFDVTMTDVLMESLTLLNVNLVSGPLGTLASGSGNVVTITAPVVMPGQSIVVTYQVEVKQTASAGTRLPNTVDLTGDSHPGTPPLGIERDYTDSAEESVLVAMPQITKTVTDTSLDETGSDAYRPANQDLAIGEIVTYTITVTMPEALSYAVRLTDLLPGGLGGGAGLFELLSAEITHIGEHLTRENGDEITAPAAILSDSNTDGIDDTALFVLGDVLNLIDGETDDRDRIIFTVTARVLNAPANVAGLEAVNIAGVQVLDRVVQATAAVDIVEPRITPDKVSNRTSGDAGDRISFEIRLPFDTVNSGPAYDLVVTDTVPLGMTLDQATLRFVGGALTDATLSYDSTTRVITAVIPVYTRADPQIVIAYDAVVDNTVHPHEVLTNTVRVVFDSHPQDPGEDYQRDYGPLTDSTSFTVIAPSISKTLFATDIPETLSTDVAIGETVTYHVTLRLPEATTTLVLSDLLPAGMELIGSQVLRIGGNIELGAGAPQEGDAGVEIDGRIVWNFGTIVNRADGVQTADDEIVVEITARVLNVAPNQADVALTNTGQADYTRADDSVVTIDATQTVTIVAPELQVDKTAAETTGDAGDIVTYTVRLSHADLSSQTAFAVELFDDLAEGLGLVTGSVTVSLAGAASGTWSILSGNGENDTVVRVSLSQLPLGPDDVLTVTYQARILDTVRHGDVLTNTAEAGWRSAPEVGFPEARTGSANDSADVTVRLENAIEKTVVHTSLDDTGSGFHRPANPDLAIGEEVTYEIRITLGEGTQSVLVQDTLPPGLAFVSGKVVSIGANISGAALAVDAAPGVAGQTITFNFGNAVVNAGGPANMPPTAADVIVMQVVAVVLPGQQDGALLTNAATLTTESGIERDSAPIDVVKPDLQITKTSSEPRGDAGDEITFTVVIEQTGIASAPLYDLELTDLLPEDYALVAGSAVATRGDGVALGGVDEILGATRDTVTFTLLGAALMPVDDPTTAADETRIILTYTVKLRDSVQPGQVIINEASYTGVSAPGGGSTTETFAGTDSATVTVAMPVTLSKTIFDTSLAETDTPDLAVGETVTYRLLATLSEGTQTLVITDTLPDGLEVLSAQVVAIGDGLPQDLMGTAYSQTGQTVRFDFGTVVNTGNNDITDGTVEVEIVARVRDIASNADGEELTNQGSVTIASPDHPGAQGGTETATDSTTSRVVEPELVIAKTVQGGFARPGDEITYTVTLSHAAGSTSAAYDIVLADLLTDPYLELVVASVEVSKDGVSLGSDVVTSGNAAGDTTLRVEVPVLALDEVLTVTFKARVTADAPGGETFRNTATADFDSAGGDGGRTDNVEDSAAIPGIPALAKDIVDTSDPYTGDVPNAQLGRDVPGLAVGETVTYHLTVTLPQGTIENLVLSDLLPPSLQLLSAIVFRVGVDDSLQLEAGWPTGGPTAGGFSFDFGTVVNTSGAEIDDSDRIVVQVTARVLDLEGLVAGDLIRNAAEANFTILGLDGSLTAEAPAQLVEPDLNITKAVDRPEGDAGDVFTYTLTVQHTDISVGAAYNLVIEDELPPFLVVVPGSLSSSAGTPTIVGNTIRVEIPVMLPDAAPITITYRAAFSDAIEPGQVVPNRATLDYASAETLGRGYEDDAEASVRGKFGLSLTKEIVATSLDETGSDFFDRTLPDLAAGETVTYHLTATLSEGTQRLVITDTLPDGLVAESVRVDTIGDGIAAGAPVITIEGNRITVDFGVVVNTGDNDDDDHIVIEVVARLNATQPAGTVLVNQSEATVSPTDPEGPGDTIVATAKAAAESVAAVLVFDKQASPLSVGLGEIITYTVTLSHAATSSAPAYEVVLSDPLSEASLQLVNGSVVASMGTVVLGNGAGDAGIRVVLPLLMPDEVLVVTFQARAVGIPIPDGAAVNTADYDSTSAPGDIPPGFTRPLSGRDSATVQIVSGTPMDGGALFADYEDAFRRISRNALNAPIILTGTAQPGAAVALGLQDANGAPINIIGLTADVGGHWMASPIEPGAPGRAEVQASDGMDRLAGREGSLGLAPAVAASTGGLDLAAYTVQAAQAPAAFDVRPGMDGVRSTFAGVVQPSGAFVGAADSPGQAAAAPVAGQIQRDMAGLTAPNSLAWNRFALDFAASTAAASMAGR